MSLALVAISVSAFAAQHSSWEDPSQCVRVVNVHKLTENELGEILNGRCPEVAIEFSAHSTLPLSLFLKGDLVHLVGIEEKFAALEIKQTFYAKFVEGELIFSTNLTDWKPFFEFITGNASIALSIQEGQPLIVVGAETNRRS